MPCLETCLSGQLGGWRHTSGGVRLHIFEYLYNCSLYHPPVQLLLGFSGVRILSVFAASTQAYELCSFSHHTWG